VKYRKLNLSELEDLRDDFVHFLSANSVTADDWIKIKQADPKLAGEMIEIFSEIVWEKILTKIKYVRMISQKMIRVMHFGEDKAEMVQLSIAHPDFSFSDPDQIRSIAEGTADLKAFDPEIIKGTKTYTESRDLEVFLALEQGGQPTDELFWRSLKSMIPESNSQANLS